MIESGASRWNAKEIRYHWRVSAANIANTENACTKTHWAGKSKETRSESDILTVKRVQCVALSYASTLRLLLFSSKFSPDNKFYLQLRTCRDTNWKGFLSHTLTIKTSLALCDHHSSLFIILKWSSTKLKTK